MALTSITMADDVSVDGRALARNGDVTLINDTIIRSICAAEGPTATPAGGPTASPGTRGTLPPTDTVATSEARSSGSMDALVLVLLVLIAFVFVASRQSLQATRKR